MATIYGTQASDVRDGGSHGDTIYGWAEDGDPLTDLGDRLRGLGGKDALYGGGGDDTLEGGPGYDTVSGDDGDDLLAGGQLGDAIGGGDGDDTLFGDRDYDRLHGGDGEDLLHGGRGNDTLNGWVGADTLDGDAGLDWTSFLESPSAVLVNLRTGTGSGGHAEGDTFVAIEMVEGSHFRDTLIGSGADEYLAGEYDRDLLRGRRGNDSLRGEESNDTLFGGDGRDTLDGGEGTDRLDGGRGNDLLRFGETYVFAGGYGRDSIFFEDDVTTIELDGESLGVASADEALAKAAVVDGRTVFSFDGGDTLVVQFATDPELMRDDIVVL